MHMLINQSPIARICVVLFLLVAAAQAETLRVNCNGKKGLTHISQAINILQHDEAQGSRTIWFPGPATKTLSSRVWIT
jgi:hypothetical protein